jgi:hypothetical protein
MLRRGGVAVKEWAADAYPGQLPRRTGGGQPPSVIRLCVLCAEATGAAPQGEDFSLYVRAYWPEVASPSPRNRVAKCGLPPRLLALPRGERRHRDRPVTSSDPAPTAGAR